MTRAVPNVSRPPRHLALAGLAVCGVLAGGFLGGTTNAVNGWVSPEYFVAVLGWDGIEDVWRASIAQGMFEGLVFGIFFSLVFTVATGIITESSCSFGFAFLYLLGILVGRLVCWVLGGLAATGLATLSPAFYRQTFFKVPKDPGSMLRYAWVGGSIWGAELGGLVAVVVGLVLLRSSWRRQTGGESMSSNMVLQPTGHTKDGSSSHNVTPA